MSGLDVEGKQKSTFFCEVLTSSIQLQNKSFHVVRGAVTKNFCNTEDNVI